MMATGTRPAGSDLEGGAAGGAGGAGAAAAPRILLLRWRMGAVGLNLVFADNVIFLGMPHRADFVHQAAGRACRLGQLSPHVRVWPILYRGTLEETLWRCWRGALSSTSNAATSSHAAAVVLHVAEAIGLAEH